MYSFFPDSNFTLLHSVRFVNEDFYKDYKDVRKKRFKARKLEIEEQVGT